MPKYVLGARGHDYGKGKVKDEEAVPMLAKKDQAFMRRIIER